MDFKAVLMILFFVAVLVLFFFVAKSFTSVLAGIHGPRHLTQVPRPGITHTLGCGRRLWWRLVFVCKHLHSLV